MKVKELIKELQKYPNHDEVVVFNDEFGNDWPIVSMSPDTTVIDTDDNDDGVEIVNCCRLSYQEP